VDLAAPVELDLASAGDLAERISSAYLAGASMVTVDFAEVLFCDSTGLRVLIHGAKLARARGAVFGIRRPTKQLVLIAHLLGASDVLGLPPPSDRRRAAAARRSRDVGDDAVARIPR
jgi:anti-anti-sigma regulatory factor